MNEREKQDALSREIAQMFSKCKPSRFTFRERWDEVNGYEYEEVPR